MPPAPLSDTALREESESGALLRTLQLQQTAMSASAQWVLPPALLLIFSALSAEVERLPLLVWLALATAAVLLSLTNNLVNRRALARQPAADPGFRARNILNYGLFGLVWGALPLCAALWGSEKASWLCLIISTAVLASLLVVFSTSKPIFHSIFIPVAVQKLASIILGPLYSFELVLLCVLYLCAVLLMHRTLFGMQVQRVRDSLNHAAQASTLERTLQQYDPLTGLFNRAGLDAWLQEKFDAGKGDAPALVTLASVVGFSELNALYGASVADAVLRELAARLMAESRGMLGIARIGGTEFILIDLRPFASPEETLRMLTALEHEPFGIDDQVVAIGLRKAWVMGSAHEMDTLIDHSRTRLRTLSADHSLPDRPDRLSLALRRDLVHGFHQALTSEQIQPWFQPLLDCRSNAIIGWEALARWEHPVHGLIDPDTFLVIARVSRQLPLLSGIMLRNSALFVRDLCAAGLGTTAHVHVNLTADELGKPATLPWIEHMLKEAGVEPRHIILELSEKDAPIIDEQLDRNLRRMQQIGMRLAIDDFGTGYANLGQLLDLPAGAVKIDRRFIEKLPGDKHSAALVRAMITLASGIGMQAIAEGVENTDQLDFLIDNDCNAYQGFLASKALPHGQALAFARSRVGGAATAAAPSPSAADRPATKQ